MRGLVSRPLLWLCSSVSLAAATSIVYVTDLTIFTQLAPCAASAVSYNIMSMTYSACPSAVTDLQSCVCSKNNNFASLRTQLSSSVSYSCGGTATDDQSSATAVYNAYCNQAAITPFPTPTNPVTQFITDIPAYADLAPCARSALSYNLLSMTYELCPPDADLLATCACRKNQNSLRVSEDINSSVKYSCSSHTADIASAQAVFAGYCALNDGTTSFPVTSDPPGDMTYYITALTQFAALAPCAKSALSYGVFSQTYDLCPSGPQALASCACLKDGMSTHVSSDITSNVKYSCDSTATEDISSALSVFGYYCSAAQGLATPAVTDSVAETTGTDAAGGGATSPRATNTGTGSSSSGNGDQPGGSSSSSNNSGSSSPSTPNISAIIGGVVGVCLVLLLGAISFFIWRRRQAMNMRQNQGIQPTTQALNTGGGSDGQGKPELDSTGVAHAPAVSPSLSMLKPNPPSRVDNVSPVSAHGGSTRLPHSELQGQNAFSPPLPQHPELQGHSVYSPPTQYPQQYAQPYPQHPELAGQYVHPQQSHPSPVSEAYGQQVYEAPGQHRPQMYEAAGQTVQPQRTGLGWQSGPVVNQYHEMDSGWNGQEQPHAR